MSRIRQRIIYEWGRVSPKGRPADQIVADRFDKRRSQIGKSVLVEKKAQFIETGGAASARSGKR